MPIHDWTRVEAGDEYVSAPLEATYCQAWAVNPAVLKELIETSAE